MLNPARLPEETASLVEVPGCEERCDLLQGAENENPVADNLSLVLYLNKNSATACGTHHCVSQIVLVFCAGDEMSAQIAAALDLPVAMGGNCRIPDRSDCSNSLAVYNVK